MNTRRCGELGETIAGAFLTIKGYEILEKNYRFAGREVDLVVRDGTRIVAVEVKLRRGDRFGAAAEAIDARKLARLRVALTRLAQDHGWRLSPRIDAVAINIDERAERMVVDHIVGVS